MGHTPRQNLRNSKRSTILIYTEVEFAFFRGHEDFPFHLPVNPEHLFRLMILPVLPAPIQKPLFE